MPLTPEGLAASRILRERRDGRPDLKEDNRYHLDFLCEALCFGQPLLFIEYAVWSALNTGVEALTLNLDLLRTTLARELEGEAGALASLYLDTAIAKIRTATPEPPSYLEGSGALDVLARDYLAALLRGERLTASRLILDAADGGTSIRDIYLLVFQRVLRELGRLWQMNQIGIAQEHYCTACTQLIMSQLYPRIFSARRNGWRLVATSVGGDLHEIGMRMVSDFFEMEGWDTFYLGANTPTSVALHQVAERTPQVLAISATMPFHVHKVAELITATRAAGNAPRILVGGAPFNSVPGLWKDVGADGYARDAAEAIILASGWCA